MGTHMSPPADLKSKGLRALRCIPGFVNSLARKAPRAAAPRLPEDRGMRAPGLHAECPAAENRVSSVGMSEIKRMRHDNPVTEVFSFFEIIGEREERSGWKAACRLTIAGRDGKMILYICLRYTKRGGHSGFRRRVPMAGNAGDEIKSAARSRFRDSTMQRE